MTSRFWHGFADMHTVADAEVVIRSAEGVWLEDTAGNRYLDATAALWYCNVGYGRAAIADAVADQLRRLPAYSSFGAYTSEPSVALAARLADLAPFPNAVVFLGSGGSDAVDTAAKLVRRYWDVMGHPERRVIVSRELGYHGMHGWGTSLVGIGPMKTGYGGPFIDEVVNVGAMDVESLGALFAERGHEIAAFIGEPVIGAGGVYPPEPSYWPEVQRLCREHDVLLIADEVITGFGRTGHLWGSQRYGIEPDMITFAKVVTSGYQPLGGVLVGARVAGPFWDGSAPGPMFVHGYTYTGHAAACAAAMANLDIIEGEGLVARVAGMEAAFDATVRRLEGAPLVGQVRTVGLTAAVAVEAERLAADPSLPAKVVGAALRHGVATRVLRGHAIHLSPAFTITEGEVDTLVDGLGAAFEDVAAAAGVSRQTVTRAMNDMPGISASTRERVQQLAAELGYSPSRFAKGLVQGARTSLGLAIPDLTNPYFPAFASSVVEEATQRGWNVVVDDFGHGSGSGLDAVARLGPQVDALVGYLGASSTEAQAMMGRRPVVVLDFPSGQAAGLISFDYAYAAQLALERLKSARCRRIAYLDADLEGPATARGLAVAAAAADAGLEFGPRVLHRSARFRVSAVRGLPAHLVTSQSSSPSIAGWVLTGWLFAPTCQRGPSRSWKVKSRGMVPYGTIDPPAGPRHIDLLLVQDDRPADVYGRWGTLTWPCAASGVGKCEGLARARRGPCSARRP